jgi:acyl-CoA thioesterase
VTNGELPAADLARLRETFERIPYLRLLGLEFVSASRGEARFALEHREALTRHEGLMHGGAIASLMDTASAFAVLTLLTEGQQTVTVDLTIHFLRPVLRGRVEAHARVLRAGRRIATLNIDVTDPTGKLTATATTTYAILSAL